MASEDDTISTNDSNSKKSSSSHKHSRFMFNSQTNYNDSDVSVFDSPIPGHKIPQDLRKVLIDFSISCLVNQPKDYIDYGVKYFRTIQEKRHSAKRNLKKLPIPSTLSLVQVSSKFFGKHEKKPISLASLTIGEADEDDSNEIEEQQDNVRSDRRKSVYATSYDLDEDDEESEDEIEFEKYPKTQEQQQRIRNALDSVFQFRPLEVEQIDEALNAMSHRRVIAGENIIRRDSIIDQNFYVVEYGKFNAYVDGEYVNCYDNEGFFGETTLLYKSEMNATIRAETDGMLWVMDGPTFHLILLRSSAKKRRMYETLLQNVPLLKVLRPYEILNLADALIPQRYNKDDIIIKQGEKGDGMYFIEDGQVAVKIEWDVGRGEQYIATLYRGGYFGEIALLTNGPRMASVYAETDTKLAFLEKEGFERLLGKCINILKRGLMEYHNYNLQPYLSQLDLESLYSD